MMTIKTTVLLMLLGVLGACGSTPSSTFYSLREASAALATPSASKESPKLAVMPINLPDLIDRPQLVVLSGGRQVRLLEHQRWAEPLRREIPRLIAEDLGQLLNSSGVVALPADIQALAPDYRLLLDVQRLEASEGVGVDVDVVWVLSSRQATIRSGRTTLRQEFQKSGTSNTFTTTLIEAHRLGLQRVAADIAEGFRAATAASASLK
ncbi:MAG: PqiC family protein [Betaproteobacteria bacterium]